MKLEGRFRLPASREQVFAKLNDPLFFASCIEGVGDLKEVDRDHFTATLETRIAYIKFRFAVAVALVERSAPSRVTGTVEGTPFGTAGRLTASAVANLHEIEGGLATEIAYEMNMALTGKLGSLGQPVMRAKSREMEQVFVRRATAAFSGQGSEAVVEAASPGRQSPAVASPVGAFRSFLARIARYLADRLGPAAGDASDAGTHAPIAVKAAPATQAVHRGGAARTSLDFELLRPASLAHALQLLASGDPEVRPFSGGTGLMLMMKSGVFKPQALVDLTALDDQLADITVEESGTLLIGGLARLADLGADARVRAIAPVISKALPHLANVRVRNAARIGGCLAHGDPHMDLPPILASLGASVEAASVDGLRTLPLDEFYIGYYQTELAPGEIITRVIVPPQAGWRAVYRKTTVRSRDDWPALGVAISLRCEDAVVRDARIVVSAATERVTRLRHVEAAVVGQTLTSSVCRNAAELAAASVVTTSDAQGSAAYKSVLVEVELRRALEDLMKEEVAA